VIETEPVIVERRPTWWFWLIGLIVFLLLTWLLRETLIPFVTGLAIAYLLDPVCDWLERRGLPRWIATLAVILFFAIVFIGLLILLVPVAIHQAAGLIEAFPRYADKFQTQVLPRLQNLIAEIRSQPVLQGLPGGASGAPGGTASLPSGPSTTAMLGWLTPVLSRIWTSGLALVDIISFLLITPVVAFYMLRDWDSMIGQTDSYLPRAHANTIRKLAREIDRTLSGFIRGQGLVCLILGAFYAIALTAAGLNFGLVIGLFAGALTFIPYVGSMAGFIASVGVAFFQYDSYLMVAVVAAIFLVGQFVEGNYLTPKLVGDRVGLHPVWVIFALLSGGSLFGFIGVMLAVPVAAVIGVLARHFIGLYLNSRYYTETSIIQGPEPEASSLILQHEQTRPTSSQPGTITGAR
jgi:predicted PurR-regulated permease PerM